MYRSMKIEGGATICAWGYVADEKGPANVLVSAWNDGVSVTIGRFTPEEARKMAAMLMGAADKAEGAAAEVLDVLGAAA